jgi:hypothetical protein
VFDSYAPVSYRLAIFVPVQYIRASAVLMDATALSVRSIRHQL